MLEIHCKKCANLINCTEGCKVYGPDAETATRYCANDRFINYIHINSTTEQKPMTNADRIRAMTDKDLVKLLSEFSAYSCIFPDKDCEFESCVDCVTQWLQQPAEEA